MVELGSLMNLLIKNLLIRAKKMREILQMEFISGNNLLQLSYTIPRCNCIIF